MKMLSRLLPLLCAALMLFAAGCSTSSSSVAPPPDGVNPVVARFFLEVRNGDPDGAVPLPVSGIRVPIDPTSPVLSEGDIAGVRVARTEHEGLQMIFQLVGGRLGAINAFAQLTTTHQGYRLVMSLNGVPVATTTIKSSVSNGVLVVYPEGLDEKQVLAAANGINYVSGEIQRQLASR